MNREECLKTIQWHIFPSQYEWEKKKEDAENEGIKERCNHVLNDLQKALEYLQENLK